MARPMGWATMARNRGAIGAKNGATGATGTTHNARSPRSVAAYVRVSTDEQAKSGLGLGDLTELQKRHPEVVAGPRVGRAKADGLPIPVQAFRQPVVLPQRLAQVGAEHGLGAAGDGSRQYVGRHLTQEPLVGDVVQLVMRGQAGAEIDHLLVQERITPLRRGVPGRR